MKTIGIKLADGSFYPILEEGTAKTYQLDLTTVKDGQTKVQIDLYRSATSSMEDAEYVDTLEVSNLVPHPNGEVELHLSVGLNEDNELDAKVVDEETGKQSETNVTLVSRTLAERSEPSNFELSDEPEAAPESLPEDADEADNSGAVAAAAVAGAAAGAAALYAATKDNEESSDSLDDFTFDNFTDDESAVNSPASDEGVTQADELTEDVEDVPFSFDSEIEAEQREEAFEEPAVEEPVVEEIATEETASEESFDLPDFDESSFEEPAAAETVAEEPAADAPAEESFDLPDFEDNAESAPAEDDFALPDFDEPVVSETTKEATEASGLTGYFDDPAFSEDPVFTETNLETNDSSMDFDTNELDSAPAAPAMDFSDLYDKETLNGESSVYSEEEEEEKKTRVPVIICIICAIICVIATLLILFIIPSKYNLIKHNTKETVVIEKTEELPPPVEETVEEAPVEEAEPEAPAAVEDQIVVAPEPEIVVPVPAPAPEPEKAKDVKYRIRWGDTLWDIADAYYKNPWRYPKIAKYNKIKNPDLIISGTDILIPVE